MTKQTFQGVLFDLLEEVIIDRAPVLRATYAEAMADARKLVAVMNDQAEAETWDDEDCFVLIDGVIAYSEAEAA